MTFLRKSDSLVRVWINSLATAAQCSFCSGIRSFRTNFATTCFMPESCIKISDTVVLGISRLAYSSCTVRLWSLLIVDHTRSTLSVVLLVSGLPDHGSLSTDSRPSLKQMQICAHFYLLCTHCISPESHLSHPNIFRGGMFKLNAKVDADSLLCSLSHFERNSHIVHMLIQWCLPPPTD